MKVRWLSKAIDDLARLHDFLAPVAPEVAAKVVQSLAAAPSRLREYPRLGERLETLTTREVRRLLVGQYEIRYEIATETIIILRIWHCRENRPFAED